MVGDEVNSYPIQLLVNYWEIRPSRMGEHLDRLLRQGVSRIATFVPWQAVESDISHSLMRFLMATSERKMPLSLILTPEVGVHYQFSGLPKDIIHRTENKAQHARKGPVTVNLPPNQFSLPSLMAPEFLKRYYSFLARMDNLLADFKRLHQAQMQGEGHGLEGVTVVLTGSFWKYYRAPRDCALAAFGGLGGDFSSPAALEYRNRVDYFYSRPEFCDPTPAAANRWKTRALDEVNHRWFAQQSEAVFKSRTFQMVRRKASSAQVREIELFTPEADPALLYTRFLQTVSGGHGDFARLSSMLDEASSLAGVGASGGADSFVHWSSLGGFRTLTDSEKQFLILKSLLLMGGQGGGILVDEEEWFSLSAAFRARAESLARSFAQGEVRLRTRAAYLAPHLWSSAGPLWKEIRKRLGSEARMISSLDRLSQDRDATLVVNDPQTVITHETLVSLVSWAKSGRTVVLPRTALYTEMARTELELLAARSKAMDLSLGVRYRIHSLGEGRLIVHDVPDTAELWAKFAGHLFSIAEIENYCQVSDSRVAIVPLEKRGQGLGLFVMNPSRRPVSADVVFPSEVTISDLAAALAQGQQPGKMEPVATSLPDYRFSLDVPPCGVLPLAIGGLFVGQESERLKAALLARETRESAMLAAVSELPGMEVSPDLMNAMDSAFDPPGPNPERKPGADLWS